MPGGVTEQPRLAPGGSAPPVRAGRAAGTHTQAAEVKQVGLNVEKGKENQTLNAFFVLFHLSAVCKVKASGAAGVALRCQPLFAAGMGRGEAA